MGFVGFGRGDCDLLLGEEVKIQINFDKEYEKALLWLKKIKSKQEENTMQNENRLVPDIRPEKIETMTETYTPDGGGGRTECHI